ncbi:unnamed protein product, partial [Iphiclides podalirius]
MNTCLVHVLWGMRWEGADRVRVRCARGTGSVAACVAVVRRGATEPAGSRRLPRPAPPPPPPSQKLSILGNSLYLVMVTSRCPNDRHVHENNVAPVPS